MSLSVKLNTVKCSFKRKMSDWFKGSCI